MKIRGLQQQLAVNKTLLPSQRDLLSRLLFQLAFNDFRHIALFGAKGTGKSTLALVLAELLSECQEMAFNVALLTAPVAPLWPGLGQQWFADNTLSQVDLAARLDAAATAEFILIIDEAEHLTETDWRWLSQLPIRIFCFKQHADPALPLNLSIPQLTLQDSQQLLQAEKLDTISLAERFAHCQNNIHLLLQPQIPRPVIAVDSTSKRHFPWVLTGVTLLVAVCWLFYSLLTQVKTDVSNTWMTESSLPASEPIDGRAQRLPTLSEPELRHSGVAALASVHEQVDTSEAVYQTNEQLTAVVTSKTAPAEAESITVAPEVAEAVYADLVDTADGSATAMLSETEPAVEPPPLITQPTTSISRPWQHDELLALSRQQRLVQLAVLSDESAVARFKQDFPTVQHWVYLRRWQGRQQWVLVTGPFNDTDSASQHIAKLPSNLRSSGPFVKTAAAIQQEIFAWQRTAPAIVEQEN